MGARAVSHGRCVTFQMAEVAMPGQMFADIPSLIAPAAGTTHASTRGALRSDATGRQQNQRVYAHQSGPTGRLDHFLRTRNALHSGQHAQRGDPRRTITEIGGMPEKDNELLQMDVLFTGGKGP